MKNDFHQRFEIEIGISDARLYFVSRIHNRVFLSIYGLGQRELLQDIATELGQKYLSVHSYDDYIQSDFFNVLKALEACYRFSPGTNPRGRLVDAILRTLGEAEVDLGVRWENGRFFRSGAKLLDEHLVNQPLHWLTDQDHQSILQPYSKGLEHFLQATKRPELLSDVITDMYEALEALAKIITGRDRDLSANAESFLKEVKASEAYKKILKEYIAYANNFRHGVSDQSKKPNLSAAEVESFIYLTGIFIRLALSQP